MAPQQQRAEIHNCEPPPFVLGRKTWAEADADSIYDATRI